MRKLVNKKTFKDQVFDLVGKIPKGKVSTYGEVARLIQISNIKNQKYKSKIKNSNRFMPRLVGYCLHQNKDPKTPCHRVVDRNGRLAPNFAGPGFYAFSAKGGPAFGWDGAEEQKRRLKEEGVKFVDEMHVDLTLH